jgi:hypothetical protein
LSGRCGGNVSLLVIREDVPGAQDVTRIEDLRDLSKGFVVVVGLKHRAENLRLEAEHLLYLINAGSSGAHAVRSVNAAQDEARIDRRFAAALTLITDKVEGLILANRPSDIGAELIGTEGMESRGRERVVGIKGPVAEVLVYGAVQVFASRLRDCVYNRSEIAPVISAIGTVDDTKLLHLVERRAGVLYAGETDGVVGTVESKERAVCLTQTTEAELQDSLLERRLRSRHRAASNVRGWSEQHEVDEVSASDGEIGDLVARDDLARFRLPGINNGC